MDPTDFRPREGGVKIVFDVPRDLVEVTASHISDAGFVVRRYYRAEQEPRIGGSAAGYVRLGAERAMSLFTEAEQAQIVAAFEAAFAAQAVSCTVIGVDTWTAGGSNGLAGEREPRRPLPTAGAPGGALNL